MPITFSEAHKCLLNNGWQPIPGGKGSHRKYTKNGKGFTLPYHGNNKDLSKYVEKGLKRVLNI